MHTTITTCTTRPAVRTDSFGICELLFIIARNNRDLRTVCLGGGINNSLYGQETYSITTCETTGYTKGGRCFWRCVHFHKHLSVH